VVETQRHAFQNSAVRGFCDTEGNTKYQKADMKIEHDIEK
jgi:hypothetical protein